MKPKDLIGKHLHVEAQYEGTPIAIKGILKEVTEDHYVFQEPDSKGLTYLSKRVTIIILGVRKP